MLGRVKAPKEGAESDLEPEPPSLPAEGGGGGVPVELPGEDPGPLSRIGKRVLFAVALIVFVALLTYFQRDGYIDPEDGEISLLDAFYYSTVTVTTTGYGDIRPVTDEARFVTTVLVTPARVLFLILLVGTTLEILAERTRTAYRLSRWRRTLKEHTIICGYGAKGRAAIATLLGQGLEVEDITVIERDADARAHAVASGFAVVSGDASSQEVLEEAGVAQARAVVVAVNRDDSAVLIALTARELAPKATIVASVREDENAHLLHQSGADSVITSSGTAGRMLGLATHTPDIAEVLEDLLSVGAGLDIVQREIGPDEAGPISEHHDSGPVVAVIRDEKLLRFDDVRCEVLNEGDKVIALRSHRTDSTAKP